MFLDFCDKASLKLVWSARVEIAYQVYKIVNNIDLVNKEKLFQMAAYVIILSCLRDGQGEIH